MTDIFDEATRQEENERASAVGAELARLAALKDKTPAVSAECCVRCDEPIPLKRRKALPGVQLCIDCKALSERTRGRR